MRGYGALQKTEKKARQVVFTFVAWCEDAQARDANIALYTTGGKATWKAATIANEGGRFHSFTLPKLPVVLVRNTGHALSVFTGTSQADDMGYSEAVSGCGGRIR